MYHLSRDEGELESKGEKVGRSSGRKKKGRGLTREAGRSSIGVGGPSVEGETCVAATYQRADERRRRE